MRCVAGVTCLVHCNAGKCRTSRINNMYAFMANIGHKINVEKIKARFSTAPSFDIVIKYHTF